MSEEHLPRESARAQEAIRALQEELLRTNSEVMQLTLELEERISEQTTLAAENRRNKNLLEAIFETDPAGLAVVIGPELRFAYVNPAYRFIAPQTGMELLGQTYEEVWVVEGSDCCANQIQQVVKSGQPYQTLNYKRHFKDGAVRNFTLQVRRFEWDDEPAALIALWDTTRQKSIENALRASEEKFHTITDFTFDWVYWIGPDRRLLYCSPSCERITGRTSQEFLERPELLTEIVHPDDRERMEQHFASASHLLDTETLEFRILTADGQERWVGHLCQPVLSPEGRLLGRRASNRDITGQKQDQIHIRQSETRYRELAESITDIFVAYDAELCLIYRNKAAEEFTRIPNQLVIGKGFEDLYPDLVGSQIHQVYREVLRTRQPQTSVNHWIRPQDQREFYLESNVYPTREGLAVWSRDITERKKMEEALAESEQRFRSVLETSLDVAYRRDLQRDRYDYLSPVVEQVLGYPVEEMAALPTYRFMEYVHPEDRGSLQNELDQAVRAGKGRLLYRIRTRQGIYRWVADNVSITVDQAGNPLYLTGILRDLTAMRQAEASLRRADMEIEVQRKLLEQREQERMQIARDLHDGPVQDILGTIYAIQELRYGLGDQPETAGKLAQIQESLNRQVGELRAFAGDLRPPALAKFGLVQGIDAHLDTFSEKHPKISVKFSHDEMEGELLPGTQRLAIYRIYQEAMNNVLKHTRADEVRIRLQKENGKIILEVKDNGDGFDVPEDWLELIRQGHLGLAGMRERAEAMGGALEVDSRPGAGTRIRVSVPLQTAASPQ